MTIASDIRLTPEWLLDLAREFAGGQLALDPCTEAHNPTGALRYFTESDNGLSQRWWTVNGTAWCNPPYSRGCVERWARKAAEEALTGAEILFLTKDDCRTGWSAFLRGQADARCRLDRGIGFLEPDGEGGYAQLVGPMWGSCCWYFGPRRRRFDRIFSRIGEVIHGLGPDEDAIAKVTTKQRKPRAAKHLDRTGDKHAAAVARLAYSSEVDNDNA